MPEHSADYSLAGVARFARTALDILFPSEFMFEPLSPNFSG